MTAIQEVVKVTVNVADDRIAQLGFGTPLIYTPDSNTVFPERVRSYTSLDAVAVDFAATTKVYKAAAAIFAQDRSPERIKVGRRIVGGGSPDADHDAALNAIQAEDSDWYCVLSTYRTLADITAIAAWVQGKTKIYLASSEDADVYGTGTTDVASLLKAANYNRTAYLWHHQSGVDVGTGGGASSSVTTGVVTITKTGHGLKVGDPVTVAGHTAPNALANGNFTVKAITDNTFTYDAPGAPTSTTAEVTYFARYTFPEAAWASLQLPLNPGASTWAFKTLSGISAVPQTVLSPSAELQVLTKNGNVYPGLAGVGSTRSGTMASGRFIDVQIGIDWLEARIGEAIVTRMLNEEKIPYTDAGAVVIQGEIVTVLDQGVTNGLLGPLLDSASGEFFRFTIPKVAAQLPADRANRFFPGIKVAAQLAGAIHKLDITVNARV